MDAANLLKPMLARGELHCIGATTLAEYRQHIEKDAAFERRFQQVHRSEGWGDLGMRAILGGVACVASAPPLWPSTGSTSRRTLASKVGSGWSWSCKV